MSDDNGTGYAGRGARVVLRGNLASQLGKFLRAIRVEQGLSLAQAATAAGLSRVWAAQIEAGELLDLDTVHAYARVLGARLTLCLEYEHEHEREAANTGEHIDPGADDLPD